MLGKSGTKYFAVYCKQCKRLIGGTEAEERGLKLRELKDKELHCPDCGGVLYYKQIKSLLESEVLLIELEQDELDLDKWDFERTRDKYEITRS